MNRGKNRQFRVLICGNDIADKSLIQDYLKQDTDREFTLIRVHQKSEIEAAFAQGTIDMVLFDMDTMNKSSLNRLRSIVKKHVAPVVVLTEHGSEKIAVQALQLGAIGYLNKRNLSKERVFDAIDSAMKRWKEIKRNVSYQDKLERQANIDDITGLFNRRATLSRLKESITQASRYGEKLSVLLLDIDNFKQLNDTQGHKAGDSALRKVAALMKRRLRGADTVGRYGGDELLIILSHTDQAGATYPAQRILKAIEKLHIKDTNGNVYSMTASLGVAAYKAGDTYTSIVHRADNKLYEAKRNGRNRAQL